MFDWAVENSIGLLGQCSVGSRFQDRQFVEPESSVGRSVLEIGRFMEVSRFILIVAPPLLSPIVSCHVYRHVINCFGRKEWLSVMSNPDSAIIFFEVRSINHFIVFKLSYQQEDLVSGVVCER